MVDLWIVYLPVLFLVCVSLLLVLILFLVSYFLGSSTTATDFEKLTTYECGSDPFSSTQGTFDIKFYLLAMLFLIFDLEIMFLLPWALSFSYGVTFVSLLVFIWFTVVLTLAFVYEWLSGALDWQ